MTATHEEDVIELCGVALGQRGSAPVADGIDWRVRRGEFWVVGGFQGVGKSDLIAVAAGCHAPLRGRCRLFGMDCHEMEERQRVTMRLRFGVVFENGSRPLHRLSVLDNVLLPLMYHRNLAREEAERSAMSWIGRMGLEPMMNRMAGELPRAWQQRIGLARALVLNPEVLLLDNPLSGLDSRQQDWWTEFVAGIAKENRRTVIVTADHTGAWESPGRRQARLDNGGLKC